MTAKNQFIVCPHCGWENPLVPKDEWEEVPFCQQCERDTSKAPSKTKRVLRQIWNQTERIIRRSTEWWLKVAALAALIRFIIHGVL